MRLKELIEPDDGVINIDELRKVTWNGVPGGKSNLPLIYSHR